MKKFFLITRVRGIPSELTVPVKDVKAMAQGQGVKPIEDSHRVINTQQRQNINGKVGFDGQWHALMESNITKDNDMVAPPPTMEDKRGAKLDKLDRSE